MKTNKSVNCLIKYGVPLFVTIFTYDFCEYKMSHTMDAKSPNGILNTMIFYTKSSLFAIFLLALKSAFSLYPHFLH